MMGRVRRVIARRGARGTLALVGRRSGAAIRRSVHHDESHVWYAIDAERLPERELPVGFVLAPIPPDSSDLRSWDIAPTTMNERTAIGGRAWGVTQDGVPAFRCWTFPDRVPTYAARRHLLEVPSDAICLEDSFTYPAFRGQGLAGTAWSTIGRKLRSTGYRVMITKIEVDNVASRRAVEKIGFHLVAQMHYRRRGPITRVRLTPITGQEAPIERVAGDDLIRILAR